MLSFSSINHDLLRAAITFGLFGFRRHRFFPWPYDVLEKKEELVLAAVNVGLLVLGKKSEDVIQDAVMEFVSMYGLLGMMTALPVTPDYMEYDITFFPPNRFIREKGMNTDDY